MVHLNDVLNRLHATLDPAELSRLSLASIPPFGQAALAKLAEYVKKTYDADEQDLRLVLQVAATRIHADTSREPDAFWIGEIQKVLLYWHDYERFGPLLPAFEQAFFALPEPSQYKLCQCINEAWSKGLAITFLPRVPAAWPILVDRIADLKLERFSNLGEMLGNALVSLGPDAVPLVVERIGHVSADGAEVFCRALAVLRTEAAIMGLVTLLGHTSKSARSVASEMLRALGTDAKYAIEMGKASKKKAIRDVCTELFAAINEEDESPLDKRLRSLRNEVLLEERARAALETILDAPQYTDGVFAKEARDLMPTLGLDLAALAWEYLISAPDHYRAQKGVESIVFYHALVDGVSLAAISIDGFARCRPSSPSYAKDIGKLLLPLGPLLVEPLSRILKKGDFPLRGIGLELLLPYAKDIDENLWMEALADPRKTIRQTASEALCVQGEKAARAVATLLSAKKADIRLSAAETLETIATSQVEADIASALSTESDGKVKIVLERIATRIGAMPKVEPSADSEDVLVLLETTKPAKLPKFITSMDLPDLRLRDGKHVLGGPALLGLLSHLMNEGPDMEDPLLRKARPALHDADSSALSEAIYRAWLSAGAEAKHKWCLYQRAVLETREVLCDVGHTLDILTSSGHHHLAGWHLDTLARFGRVPGNEQSVDEPLSWVAHWAAEAETRSLEKHARALMAAERSLRGLSEEELRRVVDSHVADDDEDRRCPILQLNPEPPFQFDGEIWTAVVSGKHLRLQNPDGSIAPPPAGLSHAEEARRFLDLARTIDDVLGKEARRMEDAMVGGREWLAPSFLKVARHPVLGSLLSGLVCLARDSKREIWFRPHRGGFVDVHHNPVEIPLGTTVSIPHRLEIPDRVAIGWRDHCLKFGITQPFAQLDRDIYTEPEALDPRDKTMKRAALAARLREFGLRHGHPEDAGLFYYSYKRFRGRHIIATFYHGAISIRSGQDFSIEPIGITSVLFTDSDGRELDRDTVHPVIRSEVGRLLEEILA